MTTDATGAFTDTLTLPGHSSDTTSVAVTAAAEQPYWEHEPPVTASASILLLSSQSGGLPEFPYSMIIPALMVTVGGAIYAVNRRRKSGMTD